MTKKNSVFVGECCVYNAIQSSLPGLLLLVFIFFLYIFSLLLLFVCFFSYFLLSYDWLCLKCTFVYRRILKTDTTQNNITPLRLFYFLNGIKLKGYTKQNININTINNNNNNNYSNTDNDNNDYCINAAADTDSVKIINKYNFSASATTTPLFAPSCVL